MQTVIKIWKTDEYVREEKRLLGLQSFSSVVPQKAIIIFPSLKGPDYKAEIQIKDCSEHVLSVQGQYCKTVESCT